MTRFLALLGLMVSQLAFADDEAKFTKLKEGTEPTGGLTAFLEKYVGVCDAGIEGAECRNRAAEFRRQVRGKRFFTALSEDQATMLQPGRYDTSDGSYTVLVTPFFSGGNFALTHGTPKKTDANGNPMMPFLQVDGQSDEGWTESRFQRMVTGRELRLQIVFSPQEVWKLPKKAGGNIQGVRAKVEAILVTVGRTGQVVGLWTAR